MRQYPNQLLEFIQKEEGNVQSIRNEANALSRRKKKKAAKTILDRIHPSNTGDGLVWGAYYDSRGYLTSGSGTLISQKKRGSKEEQADIDAFKVKYNVDPFTMTKDQAKSLIQVKLDENVDAYLKSDNGKDIDYDSLPDSAKSAVGSLVYNVGGNKVGKVGKKYSAALKKASESKSDVDWKSFQAQQKNFHGKNLQEAGVMARRVTESEFLTDLTNGTSSIKAEPERTPQSTKPLMLQQPDEFDDVEELFQPQETEVPFMQKAAEVGETILNNLNPMNTASAADHDPETTPELDGDDPLVGFELPDQKGAVSRSNVNFEGSIVDDTRFQQRQDELNKQKAEENTPILESAKKFADHQVNSFMTENIIGSTVKQAVINWGVDTEYDPSFQPTKTLGYQELVKDVPNDKLQSVLESSNNQQQFLNKVIGFKIEQQARREMDEYMATNPVAGFVGIGVASALDVTTFIPVTKAARFAGLTRSMKSIPLLVKNMGAQIGENVIQDLMQETVLTSNSQIRRWDDGDVLYGMAGSVIIGGVAGKFQTNGTLNKFTKVAQRMQMEKNLDGINLMIRSAERKQLGDKAITQLKQTRTLIEQSLEKTHQLEVFNELKVRQDQVAKGLRDTKRLELVKAHEAFNTDIDNQIAGINSKAANDIQAERTRVAGTIDEMKDAAKVAKQGNLQSVDDLKKANKGIEKQLKKLKAIKEQNADISNEITALSRKLKENNNRIKDGLKKSQSDAKKIRAERARLIRRMEKQGDNFSNDTIKKLEGDRSTAVAQLESSRSARDAAFMEELNTFDLSVQDGTHPVLAAMIEPNQLNSIARDLGLPDNLFKSIDEMDAQLGLRFDDSLSAARVRVEPSAYMKAQDVNEMFNKTNPELWNLVARQFDEASANPALGLASFQVNKDSVVASIARATKLNELLTTESVVGRFALNKSALRWSKNEFAASFYNWAAPDGVGRLNGGKLSVIEQQQKLSATYGGQLRDQMVRYLDTLRPLMMSNKTLRSDLELPQNDLGARLMMMEAYFPEKASALLRDEMIDAGNARLKYGDEVGAAVEAWKADFNKLSKKVLDEAKEAGVEGVDMIEDSSDWFHRAWDNKAAIQFDIKHGTEKMEELIENGMLEHLLEQGKQVTDEMIPLIKAQAKRFAFGLRSKDTRVFMAADTDYQVFMRKLLDADTEGLLDADVLRAEVKRVEQNAENRRARELARRKPISLKATVSLEDGSTFQIRDLLESNIIASQASYMGSMAGRTASARNGIKDVDMLDEWVDRAIELERRRGNLDHADFIERSMREDVEAIKYGYAHREGNIDGAVSRLQRMAMKYNAARLMQYTGISSIAEMNTLIAEAGYKAVGQVISNNVTPLLKSYFFGGFTGKVFRDSMYDELSVVTGVGLEDISFDAVVSSSRMITASRAGQVAERVVDNAAKMTRRATGHVETTGRRLALNSLAINYGNVALGRDQIGNMFGGLSNVNLVELGFADLVNGKAVKNDMWNRVMESIRKNALDEDGKLASESGKGIRQFNIANWDLEVRNKFADALVQQANHILVNPDSTTAKLWHGTWWGSIFNQFRTFANNAQSKVAGHNLTQALNGYRMGEMAEFSKLAQKYFWAAALGKLSLVLYGAINNAGREDFAERMEPFMGVDDFRDWTQALGRSSAITGLDTPVDTLIGLGNLSGHMQMDPLFQSSTIGQSRDRFSWQTTATGQLAVGTAAIGTGVLKGDFDKAGKQALKMSPFRRQLGVNQLLNAMGVD